MGEHCDRWYVMTPEGTDSEWFATREEAEAYAIDVMTEELRDCGEGRDEPCYVLRLVSQTVEVVGAQRDDEGERAGWLRERGFDYEITGYRCTHIKDESGPPPADPVLLAAANRALAEQVAALEAEITTLRAALAGWPTTMADAIRACMEQARKERGP